MHDHDTTPPAGSRATARRIAGNRAEAFVENRLRDGGWRILGRQVAVGRDEIDLIAIDPGDGHGSAVLVFVEVRSARDGRFGAPEESVVGRKAARTYRAVLTLLRAGLLPDGRALPTLPWRVDVFAVTGLGGGGGAADDGARDRREVVVRHLRAVDPG